MDIGLNRCRSAKGWRRRRKHDPPVAAGKKTDAVKIARVATGEISSPSLPLRSSVTAATPRRSRRFVCRHARRELIGEIAKKTATEMFAAPNPGDFTVSKKMRTTTYKSTGVIGLVTQRNNTPMTGDSLPRPVRQQPDVGVGPDHSPRMHHAAAGGSPEEARGQRKTRSARLKRVLPHRNRTVITPQRVTSQSDHRSDVDRHSLNLRHVVVENGLLAAIIPPDGNARPIRFDDDTKIILVRIPADAVVDLERSRLSAGHVASRIRRCTVCQTIQCVGEFVHKFQF